MFGYTRAGWKTAEGARCDFSEPVTGNVTLYGSYTMKVNVVVPLKTTMTVGDDGTAQSTTMQMRSFTPVETVVTSVTSKMSALADEVFPVAADREKVGIKVTANGGLSVSLGLNGSVSAADAGFTMAAATSEASPGVIDYSIGLDIPPDTAIKRYYNGRTTSIGDLIFVVDLKK